MTEYRFRMAIDDTVEADSEEEAREAFLQMVTELTPKYYATPDDLELVE